MAQNEELYRVYEVLPNEYRVTNEVFRMPACFIGTEEACNSWVKEHTIIWCVYRSNHFSITEYKIQEQYLSEDWDEIYQGKSKKDCEDWLDKNVPWIDINFPLGQVVDDMHIEGEKERLGVTKVCKKLLEIAQQKCETSNDTFSKKDLAQWIKSLGVDL